VAQHLQQRLAVAQGGVHAQQHGHLVVCAPALVQDVQLPRRLVVREGRCDVVRHEALQALAPARARQHVLLQVEGRVGEPPVAAACNEADWSVACEESMSLEFLIALHRSFRLSGKRIEGVDLPAESGSASGRQERRGYLGRTRSASRRRTAAASMVDDDDGSNRSSACRTQRGRDTGSQRASVAPTRSPLSPPLPSETAFLSSWFFFFLIQLSPCYLPTYLSTLLG